MNQEERDWLEWLKRARDGVVTQRQAAEKMGISARWVRKLLVRMKTDGDGVVVHGLRGRASNRQIDAETQGRAIVPLKQPEWHDFGPTFASEQLARLHGIEVRKETVGGWMTSAGLWKAQSRKLGELLQWDTSNHDWLEGRGENVRYLVKWIGDATSRSGGRFVQHDGTRENMGVLWQYVEGNGRMVDLYTDRAGIFMVAPRARESAQQRQEADRLSQFGRGLRELGIGWIPAYSPQARGRVERSFGTDQDRLVKHLRLARVMTLHDANKFLEAEYWPEWNERFARPLDGVADLHRALTPQLATLVSPSRRPIPLRHHLEVRRPVNMRTDQTHSRSWMFKSSPPGSRPSDRTGKLRSRISHQIRPSPSFAHDRAGTTGTCQRV